LEADSGPQAFRLLERLKGVLDLVVTDVMMPGDMDGLDLAYAVRNAFPNITVILMSGFLSPQTTKRPIVDFEFIRKPFKPEAFLSVVKRVVGSSER
jgi:DNA-binding NtrC family response regulator